MAMGEWQPIETAPKDGTRVLVVERGTVSIADWFDGNGWEPGACWWATDSGSLRDVTHWMPLPEPPR